MLCGPFILYTNLLIPMPDGSDCSQAETAVTVFAAITFGTAAIMGLIGFCSGEPGPFCAFMLIAGILIAIAPFAVYIFVVSLVLSVPTLAVIVIYNRLSPKHKIQTKRLYVRDVEAIFPDVRIDNPS